MKQQNAKKKAGVFVLGALLGALLILAGCPTDGGSDDSASTKGYTTQITGLVYDTITGTPVEGVTVTLSKAVSAEGQATPDDPLKEKMYTVLTDKTGLYEIKEVSYGDYLITFKKDDYRFSTVSVQVNAGSFNFSQLTENGAQYDLKDVIKKGWVYRDGVITHAGGEIILKNLGIGDGTYTEATATGLAPLTAGLKGKLYQIPVRAGNINAIGEAAAAKGVTLWFTEKDSDPGALTQLTPKYGPVTTSDAGEFTVEKLPAGVAFEISYDPYTDAEGNYFKGGFEVYIQNGSQPSGLSQLTATEPATQKGVTSLGDLYIFTEGKVVALKSDRKRGAGKSKKRQREKEK